MRLINVRLRRLDLLAHVLKLMRDLRVERRLGVVPLVAEHGLVVETLDDRLQHPLRLRRLLLHRRQHPLGLSRGF